LHNRSMGQWGCDIIALQAEAKEIRYVYMETGRTRRGAEGEWNGCIASIKRSNDSPGINPGVEVDTQDRPPRESNRALVGVEMARSGNV
jgi:hypothetical protein